MKRFPELIAVIAWMLLANAIVAAGVWWSVRSFELARPTWIFLALVTPLLSIWYILRHGKLHPRVVLPTLSALNKGPFDLAARLRHLPITAMFAGLGLLCVAMARPQSKDAWQDVTREGIDIVIAMDVSASMLARDLDPDRLQAAKRVAIQFIDGRPNDRIGLVVYEGEAFTQCPLTTDHNVLKDLFSQVRSGWIQGGTAVGMGLATGINRLRESDAKSRVVILLTDGVNNAGSIQPLDAAQIASQLGIRVYTIGVGTRGKALSPVAQLANGQFHYDYVEVEIDEDMLRQVASLTDGKYFRATDARKLAEVYAEIDQLERTRIKVTEHSRRNEEYFPLVLSGTGLLLFGSVLAMSLLRTLV